MTANSHRNNVLSLWRFGSRKRFIEEFPEVPPLVEPVRIPKARSRDDLETLWAALDVLPGRVGKVPARLWWRALHFVAFFTAERIGAILQMEWSDVNLQSGWLVCRAETRKFGAADKATRLPPEVIDALRAIVEPERKLIFEWPLCGSSLYDHYKRILKRAGLSTDRKSKFHMLRSQRRAISRPRAASRKTWADFRKAYEAKILPQQAIRTQRVTTAALDHFERIIGAGENVLDSGRDH